MVEAAVDGAITGILRAAGPKAFRIMVEKDYHSLSCLFYSLAHMPDYEKEGLTPEEAKRMEAIRLNSARAILPILGMARTFAARFPAEAIESKVTAEWLMRRAEKSHPELARILHEFNENHNGKGWRWLEKEAEELREYFLGRLRWNNEEGRFEKACKR